MSDSRPKLLKNPERQQAPGGPVFEFGPGWSAKTKKWYKKYILASNCSLCLKTRYVLLAGIIVLIAGWPQFKKMSNRQPQDLLTDQIKIAKIVQTGDSKIKLARRVLSDYLARFPDLSLTNGQKIFVETVLGQDITNDAFRAGANIEIAADDIKSVITRSKSLTPSQLQHWETAAKSVRF